MEQQKVKDEYAFIDKIRKIKIGEKETYIEGVKNYELTPVYAPVLDKKYINKFNPEKSNISVCGNKPFEFDEDKLIKQAIEQVKKLKKYHLTNMFGKKEHIGEYSLFQNIEVDNFMLEAYGFYLDSEGEYSLILWFTPKYYFNGVRKHIYWYGKKSNMEEFY